RDDQRRGRLPRHRPHAPDVQAAGRGRSMNEQPAGFVPILIDVAYLVAAVLFILGLKRLRSPATARKGNLLGSSGMLIAVLATLLHWEIVGWTWIIVGLALGGTVG